MDIKIKYCRVVIHSSMWNFQFKKIGLGVFMHLYIFSNAVVTELKHCRIFFLSEAWRAVMRWTTMRTGQHRLKYIMWFSFSQLSPLNEVKPFNINNPRKNVTHPRIEMLKVNGGLICPWVQLKISLMRIKKKENGMAMKVIGCIVFILQEVT